MVSQRRLRGGDWEEPLQLLGAHSLGIRRTSEGLLGRPKDDDGRNQGVWVLERGLHLPELRIKTFSAFSFRWLI